MFKVIFTDKDESCITKWKVKEGGRCSSNAVLCEYKNPKSSKSLKIMSEFPGSIEKILKKEKESVRYGDVLALVESCKHETVWRNMCADCGTDLNEKRTISSAFVAMEHTIPDLLVSQKSAHELGKVDERRLLKNRRLVLLVDLDQTIIHTTNDNIPANLKDVYHFQLNHGPNNKLWWYHTKFRPYTKKFLDKISKYYELHICTFGIRPYAHAIVNLLDPDKKYFQNRILSRDECFHASLKTLNLKALFPCGDSMVCIIDDREDVWGSAPNMIRVKPYIFFQGTADINAPPELSKSSSNRRSKIAPISRKEKIIKVPILPKDEANVPDTNKNANKIQDVKKDDDCMAEDDGVVINTKSESASNINVDSETDVTKTNTDSKENSDKVQCSYREIVEWEDEDDYLLHLQTILLRIHEEFYKSYDAATKTDASSSGLNLKELIPREKKKVLKGCNILFSGVLPLNQSIEVSWVYVMATNFGASVQKDFAEGQNRTTHVIAAKEGTEKVRKALERGIHVVNVNWLLQCTERWERVDEALFPLSDAKNFSQKFFQVNDNLKSKDDVKVKPIQVKINMETLTETEKDAMLDEIDDYLNDDNEDDENDDDDKKKDEEAAEEEDDNNNNDKKDNSNGASKNFNSLLGSGSKDIKEEEEDLEEKLADEKLKRKVLKCFDSRGDCSSSSDSYDDEYFNEDRLHVNKKCKFELESEGNISQIGEVSSDDSIFGNISDSDSDDVVNEDLT